MQCVHYFMSMTSFTLHTQGSVVVIPLWLMRTLRPKEAMWFAQGCTIDGCSGNWKPGSGAPGFILTNLPMLSLATHLSEPQTQHFLHVYGKQRQLLPNTSIRCHENHQKAHFTGLAHSFATQMRTMDLDGFLTHLFFWRLREGLKKT